MRVAAIDCGTNSIRLLILEQQGDGSITELDRRLELVRLGEGVDATGEFAPAALQRAFGAFEAYAAEIVDQRVDRVRCVATSASRDVRNADVFLRGVEERLGVRPDIITGADEAALTFAGALSGVPDVAAPLLVTDIGGGSTELVIGSAQGVIEQAVSLDIGSVRLRERLLPGDPPTESEWEAAVAYIDEQLATSGLDLDGVRTWVGVAGTLTSMGALHLGLSRYDRFLVHGMHLDFAAIDAVTQTLRRTPTAMLVSELLPPLRAGVIVAGALICQRIAAHLDLGQVTVSESDILDGVAHRLLAL